MSDPSSTESISSPADQAPNAGDSVVEGTSLSPSASSTTKLFFESNLEEYEKLFSNRYTSKDEDFVKKSNAIFEPIHIFPWQERGNNFNGANNGGRGNRRNHNNQRWNPRGQNSDNNNARNEGSDSRRQRDFEFDNRDAGNSRGQRNFGHDREFNKQRRWTGSNHSDSSIKQIDQSAK
uniref:Uncharacterized protein n=1 Tax=Ditylenchus dipsaci TaxID=166011 RepID=A0A915EC48_9BILA